jgi:hypothetical protein
MNLTQAMSLADSFSPTAPTICDRCDRPTTIAFNWHMVETLCASCFVEVLYEHNDTFPRYLKHVTNREELLSLCQAYQLQRLYFPDGPADEPSLFFGIETSTQPTYQSKGGNPMHATQQTFLTVESQAPRPVTIRELPPKERPVGRLHFYGAGSLSNAELIAAIIQTPLALHTASQLLARHDGLLGLARSSTHELMEIQGLGPAKVAQIKAAFELGRRLLISSPQDRPQVKSPADAANLMMMEMMGLEQEHMRLILLNSKNYVIDVVTMYTR